MPDALRSLFPAFAQIGLNPDRVIFVEGDKEDTVLASFEEALRYCGLVAELVRLPMTASRRLQLAAEKSGTLGLVSVAGGGRRRPPTSTCRRLRQAAGGLPCCHPNRLSCLVSDGRDGWQS